MGNSYCCLTEPQKQLKTYPKKLILSGTSTKTNEHPQLIQAKQQPESIVQMLAQHHGSTMRDTCPIIKNIQVICELGKGGQANIFEIQMQVQDKLTSNPRHSHKELLALKRIQLSKQLKHKKSIELASKLLIQNDCPFIMSGLFCCQNQDFAYEGMFIAQGGDLSSFLESTVGKGDEFRKLGESGIRMVVAGIVLALEYLRHHHFIYCDLKTDNVLIGLDGYPILSDFQLTTDAQTIDVDTFETTLTCMGPEFFTKTKIDKGIDLWGLGILIYTLAYNECPYSQSEIIDEDFTKQCKLKENKYKLNRKKTSKQLSSLINSLLKTEPSERIGYNEVYEIKAHSFFENFPWEEYEAKRMKNPIADIVKKFPLKSLRNSCSPFK